MKFSVVWQDLALAFLHRHARRNMCFLAEDCADAAVEFGLVEPASPKAWGAVYRKASALGMIERDGFAPSRYRHGSPAVAWRSNVFKVAAA